MNTHALLRVLAAAALMATVFAGDPPAYPGQPSINAALRKLTQAKEHLVTGATQSDITAELKKRKIPSKRRLETKDLFAQLRFVSPGRRSNIWRRATATQRRTRSTKRSKQ